jgi:hypothetical protein
MNKKWKESKKPAVSGGAGGAYFLGMIGAAVYYLHTTYGFWPSIVGLLKALVWPAFLVYHLFSLR